MKTFKQLISEVEEPRGGDERRFKQLHVDAIEVVDYPIPGNEHVFKGTFQAPPRLGDIAQPDAAVYDQTYKDHGDEGIISRFDRLDRQEDDELPSPDDKDEEDDDDFDEQVSARIGRHRSVVRSEETQLDEVSKKTLASYVKRAATDAYHRGQDVEMHSSARGRAPSYASAQRHGELENKGRRKANNRVVGISRATDRLAKEETQLDELNKSTLASYVKKKAHSIIAKDDASDRYGEGEKGSSKERNKDFDKLNLARKKLAKEETIIEAVRAGTIKLDDGSTQKITKEDADVLNSLFTQLNSANRAKMESRLTSGKKGFTEILEFAKNI